jgi:hypothetical protein
MKYYTELCNLESVLVNLEGVVAIVDSLTTSCLEMDEKRIQAALFHVLRQLEEHDSSFQQNFQFLFETIGNDTHEESTTRNKRKSVRKNAK